MIGYVPVELIIIIIGEIRGMPTDNYRFSEILNTFVDFIESLRFQERCYLIYGAGRAGAIIARHMPERIVGFIDKSPQLIGTQIDGFDILAPGDIEKLQYDQLIISVLGREMEIARHLSRVYHVPENRMIWFNSKRVSLSFHADLDRVLEHLSPLNEQRIFVQIGASNGNLAQRFASCGWQVFAFDANPLYMQQYRELEGTPNLNLFCQAISLEDENFATFYVSEETPSISSLKAFCNSHKPVTVRSTTLNKFYKNYKINAIDLFMIDAETMDLAILKTHNWKIPIKAIVAECDTCNIDDINNYIFNQYPRYKVVVLVWENPEAAYGVMGKYIGKYTIEEFKALPGNCFGDVLFYDSDRTLL